MATCPTCRVTYPEDQLKCPEDGSDLLPDEAFAAADPDLQPGQRVGEYEVVGKLGQGGFGAVYEAVHPLIGKRVAIKVLKRAYSSDPETASRFIAEARAVNQIQHRYIIDIFSFGQVHDGRHYYIMDLLDGVPLDEYLSARGRLAPEEAIPILRAIAEAVDAAHAAGIAHRDLKPANVFATRDGGIQLLDFGIAKLMTGDTAHRTRTGALMGTPLYMSPEQVRGRGVDHRTDIYAFGVIAFELLTGQRPFAGQDVMEILFQHVTEPAPLPSEVCPALPAALDAPILRMLEKDAERRPLSLTAAIRALEVAAREAGVDVPLTLPALRLDPRAPRADDQPGDAVSGHDATVGAPAVRAAASTSVLLGAESRDLPAAEPGRTRRLAAVGAVAAVAVAGAAVAVMLARPPQPAHSDRADEAAAPAGADPRVAGAGAGGPAASPGAAEAVDLRGEGQATGDGGEQPADRAMAPPAAEADAAPPRPATVKLRVEGTPPGTEVHGPGGALGNAPGVIELPRGDAAVELTFRRRGYQDATQSVTPREDMTLVMRMRIKRAKPAPPPRKKPDPDALPDNPF